MFYYVLFYSEIMTIKLLSDCSHIILVMCFIVPVYDRLNFESV